MNTETTILYFQISFGIGALILLLLLLGEFRRRFRPYLKELAIRTVALFLVFLIINIAIYSFLCVYFLQTDPWALLQGQVSENFTDSHQSVFQPILIAVMYFGTGAVTVKVGNVEFGFYDKILGYIEKLLPEHTDPPDRNTVKSALDQYEEYKELRSQIHVLRQMAVVNERWDTLEDEWNNSNIVPLNEELDNLAALLSRLESKESRESIVSDLGTRLSLTEQKLRRDVIDYVYKFIARNGKTKKDRDQIYEQGLEFPAQFDTVPSSSRVQRALVISFVAGILFGPIFGLTRANMVVTEYAIIGALALMAFGTLLSVTVQKSGRNIVGYLFGGGMAGVMAQIVWNFARWLFTGELVDVINSNLIFGVAIGIVTAAYLYVFRFLFANRLRERGGASWFCYSVIAIAGAITLPLTVLLLGSGVPSVGVIFSQIAIGAVTAVGVAFATDIFTVEAKSAN